MELTARIYKTTEDKVMIDMGPFPVKYQGKEVGTVSNVASSPSGLTVTAEITDPYVIELLRHGQTNRCIIENNELKLKQ